ncbi:MAG: pantoate--beta-alanine ligase, partial [candidate division Zixibacteria bacterium]|nr:pantoate--beta-alanine ligase [candidate division Zixibacteria bacterium]
MRIIRSVNQMQRLTRQIVGKGKTIGLVPTMGYLHEGHLSLIRRARKMADVVVVTIFVNPAQFSPTEDLRRYPRDEKGDLKKIRSAGGDIVFIPTPRDIYPPEFQTWVNVEHLTTTLEGAVRPTHFRGVTTIVTKLYNICRPDLVVFGMKDYQQAMVLRRMTIDLGYGIRFVIAPTVRERDGVAMSSRNAYFDAAGRAEAICLYRALTTARAMVNAGITQPARLEKEIRAVIRATAPTAQVDYVAFTDCDTLQPVATVGRATICSLAVRVRQVRLIDNMKM